MRRVVALTVVSGTGRPVSLKAAAILEAARHVFLEQGYGDASMDAIARRADVSKATLYAYFAGKEKLFAAIVAVECQRLSLQMDLAGTEGLDLDQALHQIGRSFLGLVTSTQGLGIYRIVVAEVARFPELGRIFDEFDHRRRRIALPSSSPMPAIGGTRCAGAEAGGRALHRPVARRHPFALRAGISGRSRWSHPGYPRRGGDRRISSGLTLPPRRGSSPAEPLPSVGRFKRRRET